MDAKGSIARCAPSRPIAISRQGPKAIGERYWCLHLLALLRPRSSQVQKTPAPLSHPVRFAPLTTGWIALRRFSSFRASDRRNENHLIIEYYRYIPSACRVTPAPITPHFSDAPDKWKWAASFSVLLSDNVLFAAPTGTSDRTERGKTRPRQRAVRHGKRRRTFIG